MHVQELQKAYLFQGLSDSDLEKVVSVAEELSCGPGEYVYHKGEKGGTFYIVLEGLVELIIDKHGTMSCVTGHIGDGGHFGENSLLTGKPRSLTVRTLAHTRLLVFDSDTFHNVLLVNPSIHAMLDKALAERLSLASDGRLEFGKSARSFTGSAAPSSSGMSSLYSNEQEGSDDTRAKRHRVPENFKLPWKIRKKIDKFSSGFTPVLISGETGTGRRLAAKQIHLRGTRRTQPFIELDIAQFDSRIWEGKLFGMQEGPLPYSVGRQLSILEQCNNGTLVFYHAENLSKKLQKKIYNAFTTGVFTTVNGKNEQPLNARLIVITKSDLGTLEQENIFIPELIELFSPYQFSLPPLREHKEDILPLVEYYLRHYSSEFNKKVTKISANALGILMNYDWPGNLTELSDVIHRAVMLSPSDEIISEQIFLGLPRAEGKLAYNLLRFPPIRKFFNSNFQLLLSRVVFVCFVIIVFVLFLGPQEAKNNFGITLCWYIGWPVLIISFFFLPRFWCSICALSAAGKQLQKIIRPSRRFPPLLATRSGWIMAILCLAVFWVEIVFNAYDSPRLTGMIFLSISSGALFFSIFFERYTWCRYLCPLGGLNAIFSMPSILELRANRQLCINQCHDHACYQGTADSPGCPMFRHPFLVDNNKDCILCGRCIRNCKLHSIELNLRLAPRELWTIKNVKLSDNFLIVSLGTVYFFLAFHAQFLAAIENPGAFSYMGIQGGTLIGTLLFWGIITIGWIAYLFLCWLQAKLNKEHFSKVNHVFGYGLIPLVLGGYLAYYMKMCINGAWKIIPNFFLLLGMKVEIKEFHLLTPDVTSMLQHLAILGGLLASLYATYKIFSRMEGKNLSLKHVILPFMVVLGFGAAYLLVLNP